MLEPAVTVAIGSMVNTIVSIESEQGPVGSLLVMVKVTVPAVMSATEGVYAASSKEESSYVPVPEVVQVELDAPPDRLPDKV